TDVPNFTQSTFNSDSKLPHYIKNIDLGTNFFPFTYEVKVEYPEYEYLTARESSALAKLEVALPSSPKVSSQIGVSSKRGLLEVDFIPLVYREGKYQRIKSFKLTIEKKSNRTKAARVASPVERYAENSVLASGKWVKIRVGGTGVYQITNSELSKMGFSNPSKVRLYGYGGNILLEDLRKVKIDDLQEVPFWREPNYVLFYANGTIRWTREGKKYVQTQNHYATYGCYFLTESNEEPLNLSKEESLPEEDAAIVTTYPDYALYEKEEFSWHEMGRKLFEAYNYRLGHSKTYTFNLPGITEEPMIGYDAITYSFSVDNESAIIGAAINGESMGSISAGRLDAYDVFSEITGTEPWTKGRKEQTSVSITLDAPNFTSGHLDYIRLNYTRKLALYGSYSAFRGGITPKTKFVVAGADENTRIWNVTDANNYHQMIGTLVNGNYSFVADNLKDNEYVAVNVKGTFNKVEVVGNIPNQNLHALKDIDMIIIVPSLSDFAVQAERLAEAHRKVDKLRVKVVKAEQIYNEFSSGTPDATAYRRLMKMLYDRATEETKPKYLLLFGDAAWDNRMLTNNWAKFNSSNFLLCYESINSRSKTDSYVAEDYFGFLDDGEGVNIGRDKLDIGVGRFPAQTLEQAKIAVDKTIDYIDNKNPGAWKNIACMIGDDGTDGDGDANIHMEQSNKLATLIEKKHPEFLVKRILFDAFKRTTVATGNSYPGAHHKLMNILNDGASIVNYIGHGCVDGFSHEWIFTRADIASLRSSRPAVWSTAACDVTPFDSGIVPIGEQLFFHPKGGALALFTSTRTVFSDHNDSLNVKFTNYVLTKENGKRLTLGEAMRRSKVEFSAGGDKAWANKFNFVLIGDPALALVPSEYKAVVDEINGKPVDNGDIPMIKAGGKVTMKGRFVDDAGQLATDFNGLVYPTVLDNAEKVVCLNNSNLSDNPFEFVEREKILFAGGDSVRAGVFSFVFPVPLDINYSNKNGLLNLYAVNGTKEKEGQGAFSNFLVGGSEDNAMETDSIGPKINIFLNTVDFAYGGKTNETPMLVVDVEDEEGINTTGNGIGHDLMVVIDQSPNYSFSLNSYYKAEPGNYTKGTARFSLPELSEGKHKLMVRAWDMKNNSSTKFLEFEVVRGLRPKLFEVNCSKSPAKENTTFIISHDRPQSELNIQLGVYDFAGRELWVHQEEGTSTDGFYYIDWNLTSNGGQRLAPGIYLFRASIASDGSKQTTKARKIVILEQ
ncbi:MAG: type IX secretion system sortase PorU, partial [Bacteroidaceae bacterium]